MSKNSDPIRPEGELSDRRLEIVRVAIAGIGILDNSVRGRRAEQSHPVEPVDQRITSYYDTARNERELATNLDDARQAVETAIVNPGASDPIIEQSASQPGPGTGYTSETIENARINVQRVYENPESATPDPSTPIVVSNPERAITASTVVVPEGPTYPIPTDHKDAWTPAA